MLAFTIAHLSICVLRYREPDRPRPYRIPGGIRWRGGVLPVSAVLGTVLSGAGWVTVVVLHAGARYLGLAWMLGGVALYVIYRKREGKPVGARVTVPEQVLRATAPERDFGSILVPLLGGELDDGPRPDRGAARLLGATRTRRRSIARRSRRSGSSACRCRCRSTRRCRRPSCSPRGRAGARQAGRRGVRRRRGRHGDGSGPAHRTGDRRGGAPARGRGDRARRR